MINLQSFYCNTSHMYSVDVYMTLYISFNLPLFIVAINKLHAPLICFYSPVFVQRMSLLEWPLPH